jgi:hypothetical protein
MPATDVSFDEVRSTLACLRLGRNTKRRFPREVWHSIFQLTKIHSFETVCHELQIHPVYLKRKMAQLQEEPALAFQEVCFPQRPFDSIVIELNSNSGVRAKVHGPVVCLEYLYKLFKG